MTKKNGEIPADANFVHRPISLTILEVSAMEIVRNLPAGETMVPVNAKLDNKRAWELVKVLMDQLLREGSESRNLVTFGLEAKMK